jgi:hypothetical protein
MLRPPVAPHTFYRVGQFLNLGWLGDAEIIEIDNDMVYLLGIDNTTRLHISLDTLIAAEVS